MWRLFSAAVSRAQEWKNSLAPSLGRARFVFLVEEFVPYL